jgi:hypothetical protein
MNASDQLRPKLAVAASESTHNRHTAHHTHTDRAQDIRTVTHCKHTNTHKHTRTHNPKPTAGGSSTLHTKHTHITLKHQHARAHTYTLHTHTHIRTFTQSRRHLQRIQVHHTVGHAQCHDCCCIQRSTSACCSTNCE